MTDSIHIPAALLKEARKACGECEGHGKILNATWYDKPCSQCHGTGHQLITLVMEMEYQPPEGWVLWGEPFESSGKLFQGFKPPAPRGGKVGDSLRCDSTALPAHVGEVLAVAVEWIWCPSIANEGAYWFSVYVIHDGENPPRKILGRGKPSGEEYSKQPAETMPDILAEHCRQHATVWGVEVEKQNGVWVPRVTVTVGERASE